MTRGPAVLAETGQGNNIPGIGLCRDRVDRKTRARRGPHQAGSEKRETAGRPARAERPGSLGGVT